MAQFEYQVMQQAGSRLDHFNERLGKMVREGWEPVMMSGTAPHVSLLMRRGVAAQPAAAASAAQARPQAQPQATQHPAQVRPAQQPAQPGAPGPRPQPPQRPPGQ